MSGRRQFNEEQVLDAAMTAFWRHGFEATSLADLEQATGLNKSSLYNAYGSKEELYGRCLERFSGLYGRGMMAELETTNFRSGVEAFFARLVSRLEDGDVPGGCMATMAAMELGGDGGAVARRVEANLEGLRQAFRQSCARAVEAGELPRDTDCDAIAAMLLAMTRGVAVLNRGHSDPDVVRDAVRGMISSLDLALGASGNGSL